MRQYIANQKGSIIVFFGIMLIFLLGIAGLVIDVGSAYVEKARLQNIADAAALAGAWELPDEGNAKEVGGKFALENGLNTITLEQLKSDPTVLQATAIRSAPRYFSRLFLETDFTVSAMAQAQFTLESVHVGVIPLAAYAINWEADAVYQLKYAGGHSLMPGDYGAIDLGSGGSDYRDYLISGYNGPLTIGQIIETETGAKAGPTDQAVSTLYGKTVIVPEVELVGEPHGKTEIKITGFLEFVVVPTPEDEKGKGVIYCRFVKRLIDPTTEVTTIKSVRLIK